MARFVLAGKADCPYYAQAELLADELQRSLPDFRVHKIPILPGQWKEWLESTCQTNGWVHEDSPLVWRELTERGGKGTLLGGFSDFMKHCQDYYGATSDMSTDTMIKIAAVNLETQMSLIAEERRTSLLHLHVWITGALNPTSQILIPHLLSVEVFPKVTAVHLHLLDLDGTEEAMQELRINTEDLALNLLYRVTVHRDLEQAFHKANVIILLDDLSTDGEENDEKVKEASVRYRAYGQLIDQCADKQVKVIVSGDAFASLRCSLLAKTAHSIDSQQFVAMATQLEDAARAIIAKEMKVRPSDVADVFVWGNISGEFFIDLQRAKVFNYRGTISGPAFFSQSVLQILSNREWLERDLKQQVRHRRAAVASKTGRFTAVSTTHGILRLLKAWLGLSSPEENLSAGVLCSGTFGLPDGLVLSVPVRFTDGQWLMLPDAIDDEIKERLQLCVNELHQEKD
ncbi:putative malate dehydrogenase 1B isoform X1 [Nothobranchius furzeri]|uniref:Transcript variant X2 n=1 Tax=Nothobranchius furzeri TaxID=105023 RepID=A0A9D2Y6P4_NOTFU|nr:putative malate dehydrogenase 1B isoform X2 [Nothobranchius furzeri]KAF7214980.1 transcript variant X2 [Nothobranchius furzeri]